MRLIERISRDVRLRRAYRERIKVLEEQEEGAWTKYVRLDRALGSIIHAHEGRRAIKAEVRVVRKRAVEANRIHGKILQEITLTHRLWLTYRSGLVHG